MPEYTMPPNVAAKVIGVSQVTLHHWRIKNCGPEWREVSRRRYLYNTESVRDCARRRMNLAERVQALETTVDQLTANLETA